MQHFYRYFFIAFFLLFYLTPALAQNPIYIGNITEVIATYKQKANAKARNAKGNDIKITHAIPAKGNLSLTLNGSKKEASAEVFFGQADKSANSFYLKVTRNKLSGHIILADQKKAYEYTSTSDGSAYLQEVDINKVICIDYELVPAEVGPSSSQASPLVAAVPDLQSLPGATAVVLLDFDGQYVVSPYWNGGNPINAAPSTLNVVEIEQVWKMISEDFKPFDLNITTNESAYWNAPVNRRQRVIFTPTNFFNLNFGGVAQMNSFTWSDDTPCWAFNYGVKGAGEVGSHEIGHTLGLFHDGRTSPQEEYYYGQNNWAPIMGSGYGREMVQWSKGEYLYANNQEDDLYKIVTQNGFGYRPDDHSNLSTNATPIIADGTGNVSPLLNKGIITTRNDVDVFSFTSSGKSVYFSVVPNPDHPNLDIGLTIKNSSGNTIAIADPAYLDASFYNFLPAGTYYLYIDGVRGDFGADSDYSSLGEYTISGLIEANPSPVVSITSPASGATFAAPASVSINANAADSDGSVSKVEFFQGATKLGEDLTSPYSFAWNGIGAGSYQLTAKATDDLGASTTSAPVTITVNGNNLPSPWKNGDIGAVSMAGSASFSNNIFTVRSAGYDFWAAPDDFHYVYQPFTGNATIVARVDNIQNTNKDALAGVMIRESLGGSASYVATVVNPTSTIQMSRQGAGSPAYKLTSGSAPRWVRLQRNGSNFSSSYSADGLNWIEIGSVNISMGSSIFVGMALTSHDKTLLNTSTFSNVSITTTPTTPACSATGTILREYWGNVAGSTVATIPLGTPPHSTSQLSSFEAPTNVADNYAQRIRGYICAPASGSYTFYIASDNESELWLSTSDNPALKQKIASVASGGSAWTNSREWGKYASQKSAVISLEVGKRYYVEALHKENMNGDNLAIAWQTPTNSAISVIPGAVLSPFSITTPTNQLPTVSVSSPANEATFTAPATITITASATDTDGSVNKVEFFSGNTKLGEDLTAPYSFIWSSVAVGNYTLTAKATDNAGGVSTSATVTAIVNSTTLACSATGTILREYWGNVTGSTVATIPLGTIPHSTSQLSSFEAPTNIADNYAQRIRGYICAPTSGNYTFYIASDNESELWLSTDDNVANKRLIASVASGGSAWTNSREWGKYGGQKSATITLQAGGRYYIEALHKENMNGDNLAVAWQTPTSTAISVIPGAVLSPFTSTPSCTASGSILREYWGNISGTGISAIPLGTTPHSTSQLSSFEAPTNIADNYGQRIRGYICAPASGNYTFYIAGDDDSELWLSTSENPASKQKIASLSGWTNSREWSKYASQKSVSITLQAGGRYYIEALHKEGTGGDNLAVAWQTPTNATISLIPGLVLSPFTSSTARLASDGHSGEQEILISVYPNPFDEQLTIAVGGMEGKLVVCLTDITGKLFYNKEYVLASEQTQLAINVKPLKLKAGMYILLLKTLDGQSKVVKVFKQ